MCSPKSNPKRAFKISFTPNGWLLRAIWTPTCPLPPRVPATCSSFIWVWWQTFEHKGRGFWKVMEALKYQLMGFSEALTSPPPMFYVPAWVTACCHSLLQLWGSFTTDSCSTS